MTRYSNAFQSIAKSFHTTRGVTITCRFFVIVTKGRTARSYDTGPAFNKLIQMKRYPHIWLHF